MSMFSNGNSTPTSFAAFNAKEGKFVVRKDGEKTAFSQIRDVKLTRVVVKDDEYEGQPLKKVRLTLEDASGRAIVDFNQAVGVVARLVGMLHKVDLSKPFGISAELRKAGSTYKKKDGSMSEPLKSDMANLSVYQGGYIQLGADELPPKTEKVKVGTKEYTNAEARDAWTAQKVEELIAKLGSAPVHDEPAEPTGTSNSDLGAMSADDIPF